MTFLEALQQQVVVLDGATGTMIQNLDLSDADFGGGDFKMLSDLLCFSRPEAMQGIHAAYFDAGANAVETNTFGASPMRLSEYDFSTIDLDAFSGLPEGLDLHKNDHHEIAYHMSRRGAEIACTARAEHAAKPNYDGRPLFVFGSIGPSNRVLSSTKADLTVSTFEAIADNFHCQVRGLIDGGADVLLFETQQDILEVKAAIFGAKQAMTECGKKLPIIVQVTVDQFAKMQIFNTGIHAALVTVAGLGIDVFGINCSIGPDLMEKTVQILSRYSPLPISVIPNAGLPVSEEGRTVFKLGPDELAEFQRKFVTEYGVRLVGGCCGTTPEHIRAVAEAVRTCTPKERKVDPGLFVSGPQEAIRLDSSAALIRIGERLNVRGSKKVRDAVENETGIDHDALDEVVSEQVRDLGLEVIDVCMDSNQINTTATLKEVIHVGTTDFPGAMCIDSFEVEALAEAIKVYPGRPIVNSISMEEASPGVLKIDAVLDATAAHDPLYIGLCTGPKGPGATAEEKVDLACQIIERARDKYGVEPRRLFIDVNCFPIGSESTEGMNFTVETLKGIRGVKDAYPETNTVLGVGNLTNGLAKKPYMRKVLTSVFLDEARKFGLDAAIINPNHYVVVTDLDKADYALGKSIVLDRDMDAYTKLEEIAEAKSGVVVERRTNYDDLGSEEAVCKKIIDGYKQRTPGSFSFRGHDYEYQDTIVLQVAEALDRHEPLAFINEHLMAAMQELGDGFGRGEVSLPHLLKSADVMRQAMGFLEAYMRNFAGIDVHQQIQYKGVVVIGTVYQDVHSIGKDLARTLLENYGYRVIDLGTMTPLQKYIDTAKEHGADAIGMSALLVQTSNHMITVSKMMKEQGLDIPVLIGGAPVSDRHAAYVSMTEDGDHDSMRSDVFYCRTAMDGVNVMNKLKSGESLDSYLAANKKKLLRKLERAEARGKQDAELLATLPSREISFDGHALPKAPRFGARKVSVPLRDFAEHLDKKTLFSLNWRFGGVSARAKSGHEIAEMEALFDEWIAKAGDAGWVQPQGVFGILPCRAEGDGVVLLDPEDTAREIARIPFTRVVGAERKDTVCAAQYFTDNGALDAVGIQITTSGPQVDEQIEKFKAEGDSESALFLQGLSDRIAEDFAEYLHNEQRKLLGLSAKHGQRWSPGYPGLRDIMANKTLHELLGAAETIGVVLTDAGEFSPTGTTGAVISFHKDARYT